MNILLYINIFLFIIGCLILTQKRTYIIYYYLIWKICGAYITDILISTVPYTEFEIFSKYANLYIYFSFIVLLLSKKIKIKNTIDNKLIILYSIFIIYCFCIGYFRDIIEIFWVEFIVLNFTWIPLYFIASQININPKSFYKFTFSILFIEIILFFLQTKEIGCSTFSEVRENFFYSPPGTYYRYNYFATGIAMIMLYLIVHNILLEKKNIKNKLTLAIIIATGIYLVFISGSRTSLIALALSLILIIIKKHFKYIKPTIPLILLLIPTIITWFSQQEASKDFGADVMSRQSNILALFNGDNTYLLEESTFGLTFYLILYTFQNIDIFSFLFGFGKMFTSTNGYGIVNIETLTDATFMVYVCETGFIGLIFFIVFINLILSSTNKKSYYLNVLVFFLILNTITDRGIFYVHDTTFFLVLLSLYKNKLTNETIINHTRL